MKNELKVIKPLMLNITLLLGIFLIILNISINTYSYKRIVKSVPNYINIDESNPIVYEDQTLNDLINQINKSLNSTMSGKADIIVKHSIDVGVDPFVATAIILQETGCEWECSYIVKTCNNVGGQKGYGCGSYSSFDTLDDGIIAFIDNLYYNYYSVGLDTPQLMNSKYAQDLSWYIKVNNYVEKIKSK